jgi:hypothetical protein
MNNMYAIRTPKLDIAHNIYQLEQTSLLCTQNILEHEDQYLCMLHEGHLKNFFSEL